MSELCADCTHPIWDHLDRCINPCVIHKCNCIGYTLNKKYLGYREAVRAEGPHPGSLVSWLELTQTDFQVI